MSRSVRAALFDVDGTLVDTNYLHAVTWWEAFGQAGYQLVMADIHQAIGMGSDLMLDELLPTDRDKDADADIRAAHSTLYATYWSRLRPLPGAADLLRACKRRGLAVVLASSADEPEFNALRAALDTQLKRLGGPNFTHLPVNAPKCPVAHFQQDGHMAMMNPQGRVNYEPNSWDPPGPREDPAVGFRTHPGGQGDGVGPKRRLRPDSFADHYSQAWQFFVSQNETEQQHIIDAFTFELSKCDRIAIRTRMVAALRNVHEDLARSVADGLGLPELPDPLPAAREPMTDLPASPALSILANGPDSFAGRKLGILISDGVDAGKLAELTSAAEQAQVNVEIVAPAVGGVEASDGQRVPADQKSDGGPSVLYDAVVVLGSKQGTPLLASLPAAGDFLTDAFAHCKFIGFTGDAAPLLEAAGLAGLLDDGFADLGQLSAADFLSRCAQLRYWPRQASLIEKAAAARG